MEENKVSDQGIKDGTFKQPTREDLMKWYKDQIEIAELRFRLTELQSKTAQEEAKRVQAIGVIAQMTTKPSTEKKDPDSEGKDSLDGEIKK